MSTFINTVIANLVIWSVLVLLIFVLRIFKKQILKYLDFFTALTVWVLLWMIFLGFLPEIISSELSWVSIWIAILVWLFFFYLFELFLHHHHCKDINSEHSIKAHSHEHQNKVLMFTGTILHNMLHWVVLFSAFSVSIEFGIATTIAILLHSIPQNTANYIMNHNRELHVILAAWGWVLWALILFPFTDFLLANKFIILAIMSWSLLYLALSDILPEVKNKWWIKIKLLYLLFILLWLVLVILLNK